MLFVNQEEWRASDTVLFISENNDIANQSVDTSSFISEKESCDQSAGFSSAKRLFLSQCFLVCKSWYVYNNVDLLVRTKFTMKTVWTYKKKIIGTFKIIVLKTKFFGVSSKSPAYLPSFQT